MAIFLPEGWEVSASTSGDLAGEFFPLPLVLPRDFGALAFAFGFGFGSAFGFGCAFLFGSGFGFGVAFGFGFGSGSDFDFGPALGFGFDAFFAPALVAFRGGGEGSACGSSGRAARGCGGGASPEILDPCIRPCKGASFTTSCSTSASSGSASSESMEPKISSWGEISSGSESDSLGGRSSANASSAVASVVASAS